MPLNTEPYSGWGRVLTARGYHAIGLKIAGGDQGSLL